MSEIISSRGLNKSYGSTKAVDGLNLKIQDGEFFGFLGPNGAGKTTTIRLLTGIIEADEGEILINGSSVHERGRIARGIGVLPESRGFYEWMTASEYLHFFADLYRVDQENQEELIMSLLSQVGLVKKETSRIATYSRGMKQRLGLARALVNRPRILFLDEPTLGLDPQGQKDIRHLLRRLNENGATIFLSSHLLNEVADLCSRVGIINRGKLIVEGTIDELRGKTGLKEESLTDIFLQLTGQS